ncbi:hypothetical protein [Vreelandella glaciei]|uniref:hypothetical protein n=1 Tax=Vreelandella glaciei TaxID=186761 RepID=UPI0030ED515B
MNKILISLGMLIILAGCAATPSEPDIPLSEVRPTPTCDNEVDCENMWVAAQSALQSVSGMRLAVANDNFAQTYPSTRVGVLDGQVRKERTEEGYRFVAAFGCGGHSWCNNMLNLNLSAFNAQVSRAKAL